MPSCGRKPPPERASGNWSDGETSTLIDAWGPAHLRRHPRHLLLNDWRAAASAVNAHRAAAGRRFNRTRLQCQTRVRTLKKRYKEELSRQPPSRWPHLRQLHPFLASADGPPPGFPAATRAPAPAVKQEVGGSVGLAASWTVPRRPRNGAARSSSSGFCPGAVVTKLAEVYERVEMARIGAGNLKMEMEAQRAMLDAVKVEQQWKMENA
ncbi:hypothetical protein SEVIR_9G443300v4 [Setaria viridis]|uniref:Myb/SANT-like DNA-binding domain-containing protein n=1 Tax=Setaria viridis TaxID=4556 RepID=A0A4U6T665_SETVI|nr:trihelix transcription factor ASIL1-like [Setaria viridis]TKV96661.1 hypothetical protein SEVIR_9G443300v2 [Setaria viridis]